MCFISRYEPELHPGVTYKIKRYRATLKIFSTGSITVTGMYSLYLLLILFDFLPFCVMS